MSEARTTTTTIPTSNENRVRDAYMGCIELLKADIAKREEEIDTIKRTIEILKAHAPKENPK